MDKGRVVDPVESVVEIPVSGKMTEDEIARFWAKVDRNGPVVRPELGQCWVWTASGRKGYGAFTMDRKIVGAHRVSYMIAYGPVPEGELIRHKCDNRPCVRPDHLQTGSYMDNTRDMIERDRRGLYLSDKKVAEARKLAAEGLSIHDIHRRVAPEQHRNSLIDAIQGKRYSHVQEPPVALGDIYRPIYVKLTDKEYSEILEALKKPYHGQGRDLAAKYNVHPSMITLIKKGRVKTIRVASDN